MDDMVILCAIMVVGPFFFFIVMVCSLKIFGYLNIDLFKPETSLSEGHEGSTRPSNRYSSDMVATADLNELYAYRDRWTTGLSIAANLPVRIAMTENPLPTSVQNSNSQITSQVPRSQSSRPQMSSQISSSANPADISLPMYHELEATLEDYRRSTIYDGPPPPDYNQARLLLEVQAEQHELPPPTYNECMNMKMEKICFPQT